MGLKNSAYDVDTMLVSAIKMLANVLLGFLMLILLSPFLITLVMFLVNSMHPAVDGHFD